MSEDCSVAGSPGFIDPDMFNASSEKQDKFINSSLDVFSLGCIFHLYLFGKNPFRGKTRQSVLKKNKMGIFTIPDKKDMITDYASEKAYDLLKKMLKIKQEERISIDKALNHPFF